MTNTLSIPAQADDQDAVPLPSSLAPVSVAETASTSATLTPIDAELVEMTAPDEPDEKPGNGRRFTPEEIRFILHLREQGKTQTQIARQLHANQSSVSRVLRAWSDTTIEAKATVKKKALEITERLLKNADEDQILEILDRADVLPKKRQEAESGRVNVMIGLRLGDQA